MRNAYGFAMYCTLTFDVGIWIIQLTGFDFLRKPFEAQVKSKETNRKLRLKKGHSNILRWKAYDLQFIHVLIVIDRDNLKLY